MRTPTTHGRRRAERGSSSRRSTSKRGPGAHSVSAAPAHKSTGSRHLAGGTLFLAAGLVLAAAAAPPRDAATDTVTFSGTPAAAEEVTASAWTELDFGRAGLTSRPPVEKPAKPGAENASAPRAEAIKAAVAAVQIQDVPTEAEPAMLAAPLAQLQMTSPFGHRISPLTGSAGELHTGTDFAEECGTEVLASGSGTVVEAGWHSGGGGNRIVIDHGDGLKTTYNHLAKIDVKLGEDTAAGRVIGTVGTTGASTGCHLHFEVVVEGQVTDPAGWLTF